MHYRPQAHYNSAVAAVYPAQIAQGFEEFRLWPMRERDLDELMVIELYSFPTPWKRNMYEHDLRHNNLSRFYVIRHDQTQELASYCGTWFVSDEAHVGTVATKHEYRGLGLAEQLLAYTAVEAVREGVRYMVLEVRERNLAALRLYERSGFAIVGRRKGYYSDTGEDAILMTHSRLPLLAEGLKIREG
jgi:ribosomal-protein-alanine N-acetyltransferase